MIKLITPLDTVDNAANYEVGTRATVRGGNEYIYLPGVASCAKYDWVSYITAANGLSYGSVTRLTNTLAGNIAIAQGAIVSNKYGWFLIRGVGWGNVGDTVSSGSALYSCGTTATVTTTAESYMCIHGAFPIGTGASGGTGKFFVRYPFLLGQKQ